MNSLFAGAMTKGQVSRHGQLVMIVMSGEGAVLVPLAEFSAAQKWAQARHSLGSPLRDRLLFFERIDSLVSRPGSFCATKGHEKQLSQMVKAMKEYGFDPKEWFLPPKLTEDRKPEPPQAPTKSPLATAPDAPAPAAVGPASAPVDFRGGQGRPPKT